MPLPIGDFYLGIVFGVAVGYWTITIMLDRVKETDVDRADSRVRAFEPTGVNR